MGVGTNGELDFSTEYRTCVEMDIKQGKVEKVSKDLVLTSSTSMKNDISWR